jgi:hypothetical protein
MPEYELLSGPTAMTDSNKSNPKQAMQWVIELFCQPDSHELALLHGRAD